MKGKYIYCVFVMFGMLNDLGLQGQSIHSDKLGKKDILASYQFKSKSGLTLIRLTFNKDHSYEFLSGTDHEEVWSAGRWKMTKDTFVLVSSFAKDSLPVEIREVRLGSRDSLSVDCVKDLNGNIIKDVAVVINDDQSTRYFPVFNEAVFQLGTVKSIKFEFSQGASSKWYRVKDLATTEIQPILKFSDSMSNYVFFNEKKFILKGAHLYEMKDIDSQAKRDSGPYIDSSYSLKRIR